MTPSVKTSSNLKLRRKPTRKTHYIGRPSASKQRSLATALPEKPIYKDLIRKYPTPLMSKKEQRKHLGVYLIIERGTEVLLIKKTRGPYTGTMDLPGGTPEFGESPEQTALREGHEELGFEIPHDQIILERAIAFLYENEALTLYHTAIIFRYTGPVGAISNQDLISSDSGGFRWVDRDSPTLSPLAREALRSQVP